MNKILITAVALAAMIASPALAQSSRQARQAGQAFAQVPTADRPVTRQIVRRGAPVYAYGVYDDQNAYAGWDPDPRVRMQLQIDPESHR